MNRRTAVALTASAVAMNAFASRRAAADPVTIRIATAPSDGGAVPFYARELGYFRDAGIAASIEMFASGATITSAIVAGDFELGYANVLSLAQAHERGLPVAMIFPASIYDGKRPATVFIVANDSPIRGPKDFAGKTLGIPGVGTLLQLAPMAWLGEHGVDPKSLKFVETAPPLIAPAVMDHRIDIGMITEPAVSLTAGKVRVIGGGLDGVATTFISGGWFVNATWAAAHAPLIANLTQVLARTAAWANAHPRESGTILAKYLKIDPAVTARMVRTPYPDAMRLDAVQKQIDAAARYGFLKTSFPAVDLLYHAP